MTLQEALRKRGQRCPRCNGKMNLFMVKLVLFSKRKRDNGVWAIWQCSNVKVGNTCLAFHEKLQ